VRAEDIVQEALTRAWEKIVRGALPHEIWATESKLDRWLWQASEYILLEHQRRQKHHALPHGLLSLNEEDAEALPNEVLPCGRGWSLYRLSELARALHHELYAPSAAEAVEAAEEWRFCEQLHHRVGSLPEPYRTVLLLRYWEEMRWDEIAHRLQRSRRTVLRWHHRVVTMLQPWAQQP
jgi:RNA polymerase sigma factor (sigma-70 family)